jgi:hypothetical protein
LFRRSFMDNWSILMPPDFCEVCHGQSGETYYQAGRRTLWPLLISPNINGRALPPDLIGGGRPDIRQNRGDVSYYGRFVMESDQACSHRLHGYAMAENIGLYITIFFEDIADKLWAERTFLSVEMHNAPAGTDIVTGQFSFSSSDPVPSG